MFSPGLYPRSSAGEEYSETSFHKERVSFSQVFFFFFSGFSNGIPPPNKWTAGQATVSLTIKEMGLDSGGLSKEICDSLLKSFG